MGQKRDGFFEQGLTALDVEGVAITATIDPDGKLGRIGGLWEKLGKQTIDLAHRGLLHTVVVAADQDDVPEAYLREDAEPLRVIQAATVEEAVEKLEQDSLSRREVIRDVEAESRQLSIIAAQPQVPIESFYQELPLLKKVERKSSLREREADGENEAESDQRRAELMLRWEEEMCYERVDDYERYKFADLFANFRGVADNVTSPIPRFVLLGPPGSGKTTFQQYLAWQAAQGQLRFDGRRLVPVKIQLREWENWAVARSEFNLPTYLAEGKYSRNKNPRFPGVEEWARWLQRGEVLLLLDGLDEIFGNEPAFGQAIRDCLRTYSASPTVVSCRSVNFETYQRLCPNPNEMPVFTLAGFSDQQRDKYIRTYPAKHREHFHSDALMAQLNRMPQMRPLAQNPLLLSIICYVIDDPRGPKLPATRTQLYDRAVSKLFEQYQHLRRVPVDYPSAEPDSSGKRAILEGVAWALFSHTEERVLTFNGRQLNRALNEALTAARYGNATAPWADALREDLLHNSGLLRGDAYGGYFFLHLTIHEFLTACALAEKAADEGWNAIADWVDKKSWLPTWQEVIVFLAGELSDAHRQRLLECLNDERRHDLFSSQLLLVGGCVSQSPTNSGGELSEIEKDIIWKLVETRLQDHPRIDQMVLEQVLSQIGTPVAVLLNYLLREERWEELDDEERVLTQDVLLRTLGGIGMEGDIEGLINLAQSENDIRYLAVEALGFAGNHPRAKKTLLELITTVDAEKWRSLDWAIAKAIGRITNSRVVEKLFRVEEQALRRQRAESFDRVVDDIDWVIDLMIETLQHKNYPVQENAIEVLGEVGSERVIEPLLSFIHQTDDSALRKEAVSAIGKIGNSTIKVINSLTEVLKTDEEDLVRSTAARVLGQLGEMRAIDSLITVLSDKHATGFVRRACARAIIQRALSQAIEPLARVLQDESEDEGLQGYAVAALAMTDHRLYDWLLSESPSQFPTGFKRFDQGVTSALRAIDGEQAIPLLIKFAQHGGIPIDRWAIQELGRRREAQAIPVLIELFLDPHKSAIHEEVIGALRQVGDETAVGPMLEKLSALCSELHDGGWANVRTYRFEYRWREGIDDFDWYIANTKHKLVVEGLAAVREICRRHKLCPFWDERIEKIDALAKMSSPTTPSTPLKRLRNWISRNR
jgi:HEAT repeat protein